MAKIIAHRGFAKVNMQNTSAAFTHAAKSNAYGIETDIHVTADNHFVTFHDKKASRLAGKHKVLAKSNLEEIQKIVLRYRMQRHKIPMLSEYLAICKSGGKKAVMELKCDLSDEQFKLFADLVKTEFGTENSMFISFRAEVLQKLRMHFPKASCQYVCRNFDDLTLRILTQNRFDLDLFHKNVTEEVVKKCHDAGIKINCWTVNKKRVARRLQKMGVDFITTDIDKMREL